MDFKVWKENLICSDWRRKFKILMCLFGCHEKGNDFEVIQKSFIEIRCFNCGCLKSIVKNDKWCHHCQGLGGFSQFCVEDGEYFWGVCEACEGTGEKK